MISVTLYATFRLIAGQKSLEVPASDGLTVHRAVQAIIEKIPALRPHWMDTSGELYPHVHIFVNGADCATLPSGEETLLSPGDTLDFFPPVAGG